MEVVIYSCSGRKTAHVWLQTQYLHQLFVMFLLHNNGYGQVPKL